MDVHPTLSFFSFHKTVMLNLTDLSLVMVSSELGWAQGEWPVSLALPMCLPLALLTSQYLALTCHAHDAYPNQSWVLAINHNYHLQRARAKPSYYLLCTCLAYSWF